MKRFSNAKWVRSLTVTVLLVFLGNTPNSAQQPGDLKIISSKETSVITPSGKKMLIRISYTGFVPSGNGSSLSEWYKVTTPPAPKGFAVFATRFQTSGDRVCIDGDKFVVDSKTEPRLLSLAELDKVTDRDWAKCSLMERNSSSVRWQFAMQGHDDPGPLLSRKVFQGMSRGEVTVVYVPVVKGSNR